MTNKNKGLYNFKLLTQYLFSLTSIIFCSIPIHCSYSQDRFELFHLNEVNRFNFNLFEPREVIFLSDSSYLIGGFEDVVIYNTIQDEVSILIRKEDWSYNRMGGGYITNIATDSIHYYTIHSAERMFRKFRISDNKEIHKIKPYKRLSKGVFLGDANFLTVHYTRSSKGWKFKFSVYSHEKEKTIKSYHLKDVVNEKYDVTYNEKCIDFVFEGGFTSNQKFTFYISKKTSLFFAFDSAGELLYVKNGINGELFPKTKESKFLNFQNCKLTPDKRRIRDATNDSEYLYLLSNILNKSDESSVSIDIYRTINGEYIGSALVPYLFDSIKPYPNKISISNGKFFVTYQNNVIVEYEFENINNTSI